MYNTNLLNKDLAFTGIYRAELKSMTKVYIPSLWNNETRGEYDALWCAPNRKSTKVDIPAHCWVTFEAGDGKKPVIVGLLGDSIKMAVGGSGGSSGGFSGGFSGNSNVSSAGNTITNSEIIYNAETGNGIVDTARSQIGKNYVWGGTSPETGFDCSGFVRWTFGQNGISVTGNSSTMYHNGEGARINKDDLQPGDVVFFKGSHGSYSDPGHVGVYVGNGKFVHAGGSDTGVTESDFYSRSDYIGAKRYTSGN